MSDAYKILDRIADSMKLREIHEFNHTMVLVSGKTDIFCYNRGVLYFESKISKNPKIDEYQIFITIHSIDDSGASFYGQFSYKDKAEDVYKRKLLPVLKSLDENRICPTVDELNEEFKPIGIYGEKW